MIQDIAPHNFDIAYRKETPEDNSYIMFFQEGQLLVGHQTSQQEKNEDNKTTQVDADITFPIYQKVKEIAGELTYLFALDNRKFFRSKAQVEADKVMKLMGGSDSFSYEKRGFFRHVAPKEYALAAITGLHVNGWYEKTIYCGACGEELEHDTKERMMRCPVCGNMIFPRINPAVIVAVTNGDKLLLTKYRGREYTDYALVAGFNEVGESLEATVAREVMEETGVKVKNIRYYKSQPWGFTDNILIGYVCDLDGDETLRMDPDELSVAEWVKRDDIQIERRNLSLTNEMIYSFIDAEFPGCEH